jgi:hypothetical protein
VTEVLASLIVQAPTVVVGWFGGVAEIETKTVSTDEPPALVQVRVYVFAVVPTLTTSELPPTALLPLQSPLAVQEVGLFVVFHERVTVLLMLTESGPLTPSTRRSTVGAATQAVPLQVVPPAQLALADTVASWVPPLWWKVKV